MMEMPHLNGKTELSIPLIFLPFQEQGSIIYSWYPIPSTCRYPKEKTTVGNEMFFYPVTVGLGNVFANRI